MSRYGYRESWAVAGLQCWRLPRQIAVFHYLEIAALANS